MNEIRVIIWDDSDKNNYKSRKLIKFAKSLKALGIKVLNVRKVKSNGI